MHKLIYLLIPLGFFSCNKKTYTTSEAAELIEYIEYFDTSRVKYGPGTEVQSLYYDGKRISIDTSLDYTVLTSFNEIDTTTFILKYVTDWQEGTIETVTGRAFIPYRISFNETYLYDYSEAILQKAMGKLPDGTIIYCPLDVEGLDLIEFYFKRK